MTYQQRTIEILERNCHITAPNQNAKVLYEDRDFYLFFSLKNRLFTRGFVDWFVAVCVEYHVRGTISVVDTPYLHNGIAEEEMLRLSSEKQRLAQKAIRSASASKVEIVSWQRFVDQTPQWLIDEINHAYTCKGMLYELVIEQVVNNRNGITSRAKAEKYAGFLLSELPPLLNIYYGQANGVVDIYPGEDMKIGNAIRLGHLADELPQTTTFVQYGKPLVYINAAPDKK